MTIVAFETGNVISGVLTRGERGAMYRRLISKLSPGELTDIRAALDAMIVGKDIHTSSWMPGNDWRKTAFQPIYDKAASGDHATSALMFGLLVWEAFERHPEVWYTGKFEKNGVPINGRTYFQPE